MTDEKWKDLVGRIQDTFPVETEFSEPLEDGPGEREGIIFSGVLGRMKLERITRPVVLGSHAIAAKRIGADAKVEFEYSKDDETKTVIVSVWQDDAWKALDLDAGMLA